MSDPAYSRTALVLETNYLIASVIELPLVACGYEVVVAVRLEEALAIIAARRIDIALIDFRLQHAAPEGLVAVLTQRGIPFIFCTAVTPEEVLEVFPGARMISKPFSDEQVLAAIQSVAIATQAG